MHTKLYRLLGGRLVGSVGGGRRILLITTTGRKSGLERTTPLVYMEDDGAMIVYASNGGKEAPPAWWLNLQADANAKVQIGDERLQVRARALSDTEYAEVWPKAAAYNDHWPGYKSTVNRAIPLIRLERT
ncbi:MAG: nitroreductase/quinone reductase family protein [Polyangiales bacterium]